MTGNKDLSASFETDRSFKRQATVVGSGLLMSAVASVSTLDIPSVSKDPKDPIL